MLKTTLTFACAVIALAITANANAQNCGTCGITNYGAQGYAMADFGANNCGREISNQAAAGLWAGYCTESCVTSTQSGGCLGGKLRSRGSRGCGGGLGSKFGYPGGGCGSCFGYPTGGCGFGGFSGFGLGSGGGCNLFSKLKGRFGGGCGGGCNLFSSLKGHFAGGCGGGCNLFSNLKGRSGGCNTGCGLGGISFFGNILGQFKNRSCGGGLLSKLKGRKTQYAAIVSYPVTAVAIDQCGCGNSGQYFNYAVGAEYGTAGMQSNVSNVLSGGCCGGATSVLESGVQAYGNTGAAAIGGGCCN